MKTTYLLLLLLLVASENTSAQDSTFRRHEIGIDITNTLSFLKKNSQSYLLNYRYWLKNKMAIRAGLNFDISDNVADGYYPDVKLGFQKSFEDERWKPYIGFDLSYSYFKSNATEIVTKRFGISPLLGVQYIFNKRLSASTEGSLNIFRFITTDKNSFSADKTSRYTRTYIGSIGMFLISYHFK